MTAHICSVLVLDDEPNVLRAIGRLDLGPGIAMHLCQDAAAADAVLSRDGVDVVLVDQHLGHADPPGLEILDRIHREDPDCFRIIFTGGADLAFAVEAINRGHIDAFIAKPWDDAQVIGLLHQGAETCLLRRHNRALLGELSQRNADLLSFSANLERLVDERTAHLSEAHERLQQQQQALVRLETHGVVNYLARGMAHELNNPLAAILGYAQRLRRGANDGDTARRLDVILAEVERCRQLVEQLRRMAAPLDEQPVPCDPVEVLEGAVKRRAEAGRPSPALTVNGTVPRVVAAPRALGRVFEEVLGNAASFGASHLTLAGEVRYGRVRLELGNDGETPTDEQAANATKPFFTTRAAAGNRGLGLAVAAGLLRDQEGHIELAPRAEGGALVALQLPAPAAEEPGTGRITAPGTTCTPVLVVDDEPLLAELLAETLREQGFEVHRAGSVREAMEKLSLRPWIALVADQHLPDGTGLQLIAAAVAACPRLGGRCAVMTGDSQSLARVPEGIPVLGKPFRIEQLAALLARLAAP